MNTILTMILVAQSFVGAEIKDGWMTNGPRLTVCNKYSVEIYMGDSGSWFHFMNEINQTKAFHYGIFLMVDVENNFTELTCQTWYTTAGNF